MISLRYQKHIISHNCDANQDNKSIKMRELTIAKWSSSDWKNEINKL